MIIIKTTENDEIIIYFFKTEIRHILIRYGLEGQGARQAMYSYASTKFMQYRN